MCIAGPYVLGALTTDRCPAGTYYIGSEADCRAAGTALGLAWGSALNLATVPRWCSASTTNVYFNAHPIGAGFVSAKPVCLTSGTAAPTNVGDTWTPTSRAPNAADANGTRRSVETVGIITGACPLRIGSIHQLLHRLLQSAG